MKTLYDFAQYYISRGWRVFPLRPADKIPMSNKAMGIGENEPGGCLVATTDPAMVKDWWTRWPNANIGIATGKASNLVAVDVDVKSGGEESLLALKAEYGRDFTETIQAMTGGGGRHLLYAYPAGAEIHNSASKLAQGIDVRGEGGYIAAAPSMHPSGVAYQWDYEARPSITPLASMPEWMIEKLHVNTNQPAQSYEPGNGEIIEGGRNQSLASFAGSMRRRGMTFDAIVSALKVENEQRCRPPLQESEVINIARSVTRYEPTTPPRGKPAQAAEKITFREPMNAYQVGEQFITLLDNLQGRSIPTFLTPLDNATGGLERQNLSILAARPGMGKTTIAWQIARMVSTGGLTVLFASLEMSAASLWAKAVCGSLAKSWRDIRAAGGASPSLKAQLINRTSELMDKHHALLLVDDGLHTTDTIKLQVEKVKPDLLIVDHLRLMRHDKSDNETHRLGAVTRILKEIAKEQNCHVMCLAQLSRDVEKRDNKRPTLSDLRDSGEIEENADLVLMMYRPDYYEDDHHRTVTKAELLIRKARDGFSSGTINMDFHANYQWFSAPGAGAEY